MIDKICFDLRKSLLPGFIIHIIFVMKVCKHRFYAIIITTTLTCTSEEIQIMGSYVKITVHKSQSYL